MMKISVFSCVLLLFLSCSKQIVSFDYDRKQDFSQIRDYRIEFGDNTISKFNGDRLTTAIQNEFSLKGMVLNENSVNLVVISGEEYITEAPGSNVGIGMGGGGGNMGMGAGIDIPVNSKMLVLDYVISLYNSSSQLVWDGKLDVHLSAKAKPEVLESNINKGVQKLFRNFPPKK